MKRVIAFSTALFIGSTAAIAGQLSESDIAACQAEVKGHYGENAEVKLITSRSYRDGTRILMAADVGPDTKDITRTYIATCWAPAMERVASESGESDRPFSGAEVAAVE